VLRQPIYEKDRLDPVDPAAELKLDQGLLAQFPEGYRHLAYLQVRIGYAVKRECRASTAPRSKRSTPAARGGSRARGCRVRKAPRRRRVRTFRDQAVRAHGTLARAFAHPTRFTRAQAAALSWRAAASRTMVKR
jgi:hypothetical protein